MNQSSPIYEYGIREYAPALPVNDKSKVSKQSTTNKSLLLVSDGAAGSRSSTEADLRDLWRAHILLEKERQLKKYAQRHQLEVALARLHNPNEEKPGFLLTKRDDRSSIKR